MNILGKEMPQNVENIYRQIKSDHGTAAVSCVSGKDNSVQRTGINSFRIIINTDLPDDYFWEIFLHENIHIIQTCCGYRNVNDSTPLMHLLTDAIMDIDVHRRLQKYGFTYSDYGDKKLLLNIMKLASRIQENHNILYYLIISIALYRIAYDQEMGDVLASGFSKDNQIFKEVYTKFVQLLDEHSATNCKENAILYNEAIKLFNLLQLR